jgi:prevent-host-death family protein
MVSNLEGARELKTRLGTYLRRVRRGKTLVVADRGRPVAELRPRETDSALKAVLAALSTDGLVTLRRAHSPLPFRPIRSRGRSAESAVLKDRADRV